MRPLCPAEDGSVSWEAYRSHQDPGRLVLVERWASRPHWEAHDAGDAIQKIYIPEIMPRIEREVQPSMRVHGRHEAVTGWTRHVVRPRLFHGTAARALKTAAPACPLDRPRVASDGIHQPSAPSAVYRTDTPRYPPRSLEEEILCHRPVTPSTLPPAM
ncbi:antibiotic biosynthesis monooxygenase [Streptomyces sp. CT34]|uniref:putative quinol monooxygenase n=1 Tax=Streptomyces sp. CT34 TaxID=1553907 RepID=UPI00099BE5D8|nr:antibiotic biosynthesis monooxygenase [Streptomyces sp. CT34]